MRIEKKLAFFSLLYENGRKAQLTFAYPVTEDDQSLAARHL
jgi:hypothetical protein